MYDAVQSSVSAESTSIYIHSEDDRSSKTPKTPLYHLAMIFASLQYSERAVVDPTPLIESLGLKKTDQQDAAE